MKEKDEAQMVSVTVRIDKELHKQCKLKLVKEEVTFVDLVRRAVEDYVSGQYKI